MSKKILSLALVVVMLISMFAFSTSAADLKEGQIGIKVVSDAKVGAPAGTVVTVKVYYVLPAGEDVQLAVGNTSLGYNNTVYSVDSSTFKYGTAYAPYFSFNAASTCNAKATMSNQIVKKFNDSDNAKGWNAALQVQQAYENVTYTKYTGYTPVADCEVFSLQFTTLKVLTANDVIGVVDGAYNNGNNFKINKFDDASTTKFTTYDKANVDFSEAVAAPAAPAEVKVEHFDTMGQMGNWETLTGKFNGGLVGKISNLDLAFDGNECTNLLKIEVALTTATGSSKAEAYQVYEQADGSYLFRAVIKDMDITSEANISAVYTIYVDTDADGEADKTYSSEAVNVNAKGIYEEALANYKAA